MHLRPAHAADVEGIARLAAFPITARWLGSHPWVGAGPWRDLFAQAPSDTVQPFVAVESGAVQAAAILRLHTRARARHLGALRLLVSPSRLDLAAALLKHVCDRADRWLGLARLEIIGPTRSPITALLEPLGFEAELEMPAGGFAGGRLHLTAHGRLRPGWTPQRAPAMPDPPRPGGKTPAFEIRGSAAGDGAAAASIFAEDSVLWGTLQPPASNPDLWQRRFEENHLHGVFNLVADHEGQVLGNVSLAPLPAPRHDTLGLGISVATDWQGRGVGRALMTQALQAADHWLGAGRVELSVYAENTRARALYVKLGFRELGVQRAQAWSYGGYRDGVAMARLNPTLSGGGALEPG